MSESGSTSASVGEPGIWFHKVMEAAHEGIGIIDREGRLTYVNPRLAEMVGYTVDEVLGRRFYEFHANAVSGAGEARLQQRREGVGESYEVRLRHKNGSDVWVLMNANPILNERKEMVASLGMVFDITSRRKAEAALRENEERFRLAVESSPDVMFYQDTHLRFTWISKTIPPLRPEDVIDRTDFDVIDAVQARELVQTKQRVLDTGKMERVENHVDIGGKRYYFQTDIVRRVDADGRVLGVAGYCRDVTASKLAEKALIELNATLEQRVAERTQSLDRQTESLRQLAEHNRLLVQEVEHRVGNNLAGLIGLVSVMRERTGDVDAFAEAFVSRLRGMAHVHQMMTDTGWKSLILRDLIASALGALVEGTCHTTEEALEGPTIEIAARQVQPLTMVLLELYTNSCKYGAHSVPRGKLSVQWSVERSGDSENLRLHWRERNGPMITGPMTPSLGTQLIQAFAARELRGRVELTFPPEGADHLIEFPLVF